jgi:hypothetical protein
MWVNKQDLDAIAAEQRRAMKAILDDIEVHGRTPGCPAWDEANVG